MDRCHFLVEWADLAAAEARATAHFSAARCSVSVSSTLRRHRVPITGGSLTSISMSDCPLRSMD